MLASANQTIKSNSSPLDMDWSGINWPHCCLKAQGKKQLHMECIRISHIKYVNFHRSNQSSSNDPMVLRSGVTTQMTLHCVLMTWDVVSG